MLKGVHEGKYHREPTKYQTTEGKFVYNAMLSNQGSLQNLTKSKRRIASTGYSRNNSTKKFQVEPVSCQHSGRSGSDGRDVHCDRGPAASRQPQREIPQAKTEPGSEGEDPAQRRVAPSRAVRSPSSHIVLIPR
jgi:hypothetical protein